MLWIFICFDSRFLSSKRVLILLVYGKYARLLKFSTEETQLILLYPKDADQFLRITFNDDTKGVGIFVHHRVIPGDTINQANQVTVIVNHILAFLWRNLFPRDK